MTEDIQLRGRRVQAQLKVQPCAECGEVMETVGSRCRRCIERAWWKETLARQSAIASEYGALKALYVKQQGKRGHIALFDVPIRAFCGEKLPGPRSEAKMTRARIPVHARPLQLPIDTCEQCAAVLAKVLEEQRCPE